LDVAIAAPIRLMRNTHVSFIFRFVKRRITTRHHCVRGALSGLTLVLVIRAIEISLQCFPGCARRHPVKL
jgi:hypothetical protein